MALQPRVSTVGGADRAAAGAVGEDAFGVQAVAVGPRRAVDHDRGRGHRPIEPYEVGAGCIALSTTTLATRLLAVSRSLLLADPAVSVGGLHARPRTAPEGARGPSQRLHQASRWEELMHTRPSPRDRQPAAAPPAMSARPAATRCCCPKHSAAKE